MILTGLQITNKNPLIVNFYIDGKPIKEDIKINDIGLINDILEYFFRTCDESISPQCLWSTANGVDYMTLILDYDYYNKEYFNIVLNYIKELLNYKHIKEDEFTSICVSYPRNWRVTYICEKNT